MLPGIDFERDFIVSKPITRTCDKKEHSCGNLTDMLLDYDSFEESYRAVEPFLQCGNKLPVDIEFSMLDYTKEEHSFSTNCPQGELRAVVFRDSFFEALVPYISLNFKEVIYLWKQYDPKNVEELFRVFKPDIVIEEIGERIL